MTEEKEHPKRLKRIKLLDEFLMFFARNKIGFKILDEDKKHYTIKFLPDGVVDFHETIEGKEKKYPKTGKLDLRKFAKTTRETLATELPKIMKEIDIDDPKFENVEVMVCPTKEMIRKEIEPIEVKKKGITIDRNKVYDMFFTVPMKDLHDYDFRVAFFAEKEGEEHALYRIEGRYFLLKIADFSMLLEKIAEESNIFKEH